MIGGYCKKRDAGPLRPADTPGLPIQSSAMDVSRLTKFPVRYAGRGAQRGLALVTVLWVLMLLALMAAGFTRTMRLEVNLARKCRGPARSDAGTDGEGAIRIEGFSGNGNQPPTGPPNERKRPEA